MFDGWTANDFTALGTCIYAAVAAIAAVVVYFQVREARRTREDQVRPFVVVDIQPSTVSWIFFNLVIENVGKTLAREVHLKFTPPIATTQKGYDLPGSVMITEGIPSLPPGRRIEVFFDHASDRKKSDLPMRYDAEVSYSDAHGEPQEPLRYVIDLGYLYGLQRFDEYGVHHAAKALREIESTLKKWNGTGGRLKVWSRDEDEYNFRDHVEYEMTGDIRGLGQERPSELMIWLGRNVFVRTGMRTLRRWKSGRRASRTR